jgi:peptidoglycan/LPS O-acetylase OafA/YrhL
MALNFIYGQTQGWKCAVLGVAPTLLLATLSWRYVEYPALQLKKRMFHFRETPQTGHAWTPENLASEIAEPGH